MRKPEVIEEGILHCPFCGIKQTVSTMATGVLLARTLLRLDVVSVTLEDLRHRAKYPLSCMVQMKLLNKKLLSYGIRGFNYEERIV